MTITIESVYARAAGMHTCGGSGGIIHYTDTIVTDGRRRWCVTSYPTASVVRPAWGEIPDVRRRPMRACGLRVRILLAACAAAEADTLLRLAGAL